MSPLQERKVRTSVITTIQLHTLHDSNLALPWLNDLTVGKHGLKEIELWNHAKEASQKRI